MRRNGVTLLELLLVMFIAGLLVAGLITGFRSITILTEDKAARSTVRMLLAASDAYYARFRTYPTNIETGPTSLLVNKYLEENPNTATPGTVSTHWTYEISGASATGITIAATGRANTNARGRTCSVTKSIAGGTVTITSTGTDGTDWYNTNR